MKNLFVLLIAFTVIFNGCISAPLVSVQPKNGVIELPPKGELRVWKDDNHASFTVTLTNNAAKQSCEIYKVKNGSEKWISPSLLAGTSMTIDVPSNGHLYFKNFNDNVFKIEYAIEN